MLRQKAFLGQKNFLRQFFALIIIVRKVWRKNTFWRKKLQNVSKKKNKLKT